MIRSSELADPFLALPVRMRKKIWFDNGKISRLSNFLRMVGITVGIAKSERRARTDREASEVCSRLRAERIACLASVILRREKAEIAACETANILRWHLLYRPLVETASEARKAKGERRAARLAKIIRVRDHLGRPRRRSDCLEGGFNCERPCPYVTCREHLFLNVDPELGAIKFSWPEKEPDELDHTCALDVADEGAHVLEDIASRVNMVRERVRQLEIKGIARMRILMCRKWRKLPKSNGPILVWYFREQPPMEQDETD